MSASEPVGTSSRASHEMVDHTSEVTMRLRATAFPELVAEAARAFADLVPSRLRGEPDAQLREIHLEAGDRVAALVDWLNEIVYLSEAEEWLPTDVDVARTRTGGWHIRARGEALSAPFVLVKAATLHGAFVRETEGNLEAEVTLDV